MNVSMQEIYDLLSGFSPETNLDFEQNSYLDDMMLLDNQNVTIEPNVLYYCTTATFSEHNLLAGNGHFLCIMEPNDVSTINQVQGIEYITIRGSKFYTEIFNRVQTLFLSAHRNIRQQKELIAWIQNGGDMQSLADISPQLLGNPMSILDTSYTIHATTRDVLIDDPVWYEQNQSGYLQDRIIHVLKTEKIIDRIYDSKKPFYVHTTANKYGWLVCSIRINEVVVGFCAVYEASRPFTNRDFEMLDQMCIVISVQMQKSDFFILQTGLRYEYFLAALLEGKITDSRVIDDRLKSLDCTFQENMVILTVDFQEVFSSGNSSLKILMKELRNIIYGSLSLVYNNQIVMVVSRKAVAGLSSIEIEALREFLSHHHLVVGISRSFHSPLEIPIHYLQAKEVIELGRKMDWGNEIYRYQDYSFFHLLKLCNDTKDLINFCHPAILKLKEYDKKSNSVLLETLYFYLKFDKNPTQITNVLHIHRSTLFYRVEKIANLGDIDLHNGNTIFELQLSFRLLEYISKND